MLPSGNNTLHQFHLVFLTADVDQYPYIQDWTANSWDTYYPMWYDLEGCIYTVKSDVFGLSCSLSLTDVCNVLQGMMASNHTALLQSTPGTPVGPTDTDTKLWLIPYSYFKVALGECADEEQVLTVFMQLGHLLGETMLKTKNFTVQSLCKCMIFIMSTFQHLFKLIYMIGG